MTQPGAPSTPPAEKAAKAKPGVLIRYGVYLSLIALGLLVIAALRSGVVQPPMSGTAVADARLDDLTARVEKLEKAAMIPGKSEPVQAVGADEDSSRPKNGITDMEAALSELQAQVKKETQAADATRGTAKAQLAMMAAFVQLRAAVDSGGDFSIPLQALKQAAADNGEVMAAAAQMEPFAASGIVSLASLREEFKALQAQAQNEMRKAEAKTWKERLLAELQRIVSVRPLRGAGGGADSLDAVAYDLDRHDLAAALNKAKSLPEPAQEVLKDWRAKAEARHGVETALASIAAHFLSAAQAGD